MERQEVLRQARMTLFFSSLLNITNARADLTACRSWIVCGKRPTRGARMDTIIKSETITVERKNFIFDLRENPRGRFLRITEDANGRRDSIDRKSTRLNSSHAN